MKYSVAPREARYQVVNDDPKVQARLEELGLDKFTALSVGTESGQLCIVPLDESSRENAELIARACNAHDDLVKALEWIATRYDDSKSTSQVAEDAYDMSCVARAALAKAGAE